MKQMTLGSAGFEKHSKATRRSQFLAQMERVVPWKSLCALIEPHYGDGSVGRPPMGIERMLRIYFLQQWFNLSDPAVEEAMYDSLSMRSFVGIDLSAEAALDETTILRFRHLLERHGLGRRLFDEVARHLKANGLKVATGTIVDASIIGAPSSTQNKDGKRDPEMHQTKKGNQWFFGMKAHIGVDSKTKLIHSVAATSANVHDKHALTSLLHGRERRVYGDSAYAGQSVLIKSKARRARDFTQRCGRGYQYLSAIERTKNRNKSKVRSKVEHAFLIIKRIFGFAKVRYRGMAKNLHRLQVTCALANLYMARHHLLRQV
jgi:IS5 family transposase